MSMRSSTNCRSSLLTNTTTSRCFLVFVCLRERERVLYLILFCWFFLLFTGFNFLLLFQGTNFQFVKVLKANVEFSGSCIYYLTFQAEDTASGAFENFQARVILHYTLERKVDLVRLEPKKSQPVEGTFWLLIYSSHNSIFN